MKQDVNARIEQYQNGAITLHEFILTMVQLYVRNQETIDANPNGLDDYIDTMPHNEPQS